MPLLECGKNGSQISRKDHITVKLSSNLLRKIYRTSFASGVLLASGVVCRNVWSEKRIAAPMTRGSFGLDAASRVLVASVMLASWREKQVQPTSVTS
jgi:hypothetical protein